MGISLLAKTQRIYRDHGSKTLSIRVLKKLVAPVVRVGSVYFLARDLSTPMPPLRHIPGIVIRQASNSDVDLLDHVEGADRLRAQAEDRLSRGHIWFIATEESTGKLAHYRWVSTTTAFIPELNRQLVVGPRQAYFYDLYTLPEFRRRGIDGYSRHLSYTHLYRHFDIDRVIVYICADNHASLSAARPWLRQIGRVWYVQASRCETRLFMLSWKGMPELRPVSTS
jgi:hypothetical protein